MSANDEPTFVESHTIGGREVEVDATGDVEIWTGDDSHGVAVTVTMSITELQEILKKAKAHYHSYAAYKASDYNPSVYHDMKKVFN